MLKQTGSKYEVFIKRQVDEMRSSSFCCLPYVPLFGYDSGEGRVGLPLSTR